MTNGAEFIVVNAAKDQVVNPDSLSGIDGIILIGGPSVNDRGVISAIKYCLDNKKAIGAIGGASVILINADERFISKKITTAEEYSPVMMEKKANYTGESVQADGLVVTTTGFDDKAVKAFLNAYKGVLR